MEEAYKSEDRELEHLIGPGVEHKYEPNTLERLLAGLAEVAERNGDDPVKEVHLQTRTLRYSQVRWVEALKLEEHWRDSRIDVVVEQPESIVVKTKNIAAMRLTPGRGIDLDLAKVVIDGSTLSVGTKRPTIFVKNNNQWMWMQAETMDATFIAKLPGLTGPIDDAFFSGFLVVIPTGMSHNPAFQHWQEAELKHFSNRWRALMRSELPTKRDTEVTAEDLESSRNLVLWGDPDSNAVMGRLLKGTPIGFSAGAWRMGDRSFDGNQFVPAAIYPRRNAKGEYHSYVVLNSGLTFREGHDRTNSQQNPKLPDWAVIDITQPPDAFSPGRIHDAGFFDEEWKLKGPVKGP
jgi:hypothetical protein